MKQDLVIAHKLCNLYFRRLSYPLLQDQNLKLLAYLKNQTAKIFKDQGQGEKKLDKVQKRSCFLNMLRDAAVA